ncbi:MAG: hypothetical protein U0X93_03880 [Anaerolineales bacterium]
MKPPCKRSGQMQSNAAAILLGIPLTQQAYNAGATTRRKTARSRSILFPLLSSPQTQAAA